MPAWRSSATFVTAAGRVIVCASLLLSSGAAERTADRGAVAAGPAPVSTVVIADRPAARVTPEPPVAARLTPAPVRTPVRTHGRAQLPRPIAPTPAPKAATPKTTAPKAAVAAPAATATLRVEQAADRTPFNWRTSGVTFTSGCHPRKSRCHWATYDPSTNTIWIGGKAHASAARLQYVVAHELAHVWQYSHDIDARTRDLADWGYSGMDGLERAADCLAAAWGFGQAIYWNCPADAKKHIANTYTSTT
jgi:hypothetical protein